MADLIILSPKNMAISPLQAVGLIYASEIAHAHRHPETTVPPPH